MNRAERRRRGHRGPLPRAQRHRHDDYPVPILPGIVPDLTEESKRRAMAQAHEDLPAIPGTQVRVLFMSIDDGLTRLASIGYTPEQLQQLRDQAELVGGDDPHMAVATRSRP